MDVVARDGLGSSFFIDTTCRNPLVSRYCDGATTSSAFTSGHAARIAEEEKQKRYPPIDGVRVTTAAVETYGRFGGELAELLTTLHGMAQHNDSDRGLPPCNWRAKWVAQIGACVARRVSLSIDEAVQLQAYGA